jgi:hypothetical protein
MSGRPKYSSSGKQAEQVRISVETYRLLFHTTGYTAFDQRRKYKLPKELEIARVTAVTPLRLGDGDGFGL